jgi:hypothetical protein
MKDRIVIDESGFSVVQRAKPLSCGEKVIVMRIAKQGECGWRNIWVPKMDATVGKMGEISRTNDWGVLVVFEDGDVWIYPDHVLARPPDWYAVETPKASKKPKRTRAGLKVPAWIVMGSYKGRTYMDRIYTYGRNGSYGDGIHAKLMAMGLKNEINGELWIEQGWVTVKLPRRRFE